MRKLLLGTTALAAAATLSTNAALAEVTSSVTGYYEWRYESRSSQVTTTDGTKFAGDSEITFKFNNKTDDGLDITLKTEMFADAADSVTNMDEAGLTIVGGFGTVMLGAEDGVNDIIPSAAADLVSEEMFSVSGASVADTDHNLGIKNGDMANLGSDSSKITYMPNLGMTGLVAGISHTNASMVGGADTTEFGASYTMDAGGASIEIAGVSGTTENSTQDIDSQQVSVKIASGNLTMVLAQAEYEASGDDEQGTDVGIKFQVNDAMSLVAYTSDVEDDSSLEEYTNTGAEMVYTITSGLAAIITVEDYDYKVGTSGNTADNGTHSKLTVKATF